MELCLPRLRLAQWSSVTLSMAEEIVVASKCPLLSINRFTWYSCGQNKFPLCICTTEPSVAFRNCRAGSSANNLALLNFEYLSIYLSIRLCAYNLECNQSMIPLSPPTLHSMHSTCNHMAHRWRNLLQT